MRGKVKAVKYPRVYVSQTTHKRVQRIALKTGKDMKSLGNKIVLAGIKALDL